MLNLRPRCQLLTLVLACLLFTGVSTSSRASTEQRYYDIEIVLFQNSASLKSLPELETYPEALTLPENYIQLGLPTSTIPAEYIPEYYFKLLPGEDLKLRDAAEKIATSKSYRILKHFAWRQPGLAREISIPIVFHDEIAAETPEPIPGVDEQAPLLYTQAKLYGVFNVSLSRFLHLDSVLRFEANGLAPLPETSTETLTTETQTTIKPRPLNVVYIEKQKRRMRSKEVHYIDHPVIGMLVLMTPVEIPEEATSPDTVKVTR